MPQTNPRSLANLRRGGTRSPGRRPVVREAREWERRFLESPEYRESARRRVLAGKAPHLERLWHEHVYGKATKLELTGADATPLRLIQVIHRHDPASASTCSADLEAWSSTVGHDPLMPRDAR